MAIGRRRLLVLAASAAAMPLASMAQPIAGARLVGILTGGNPDDPTAQSIVTAILDGLAEEGWRLPETIVAEVRFNLGSPELSQQFARELVRLGVDILVAAAPPNAIAAVQATSEIPVVFFAVGDPVGNGLVQSYSRPGGNATGFTKEGLLAGKCLELLMSMAPRLARVGMIFDPDVVGPGEPVETPFLEAARTFGVEGVVAHVRNIEDVEAALSELATRPGGGLVVGSDNFTFSNRRPILEIVTRREIPTIYSDVESVVEGGLMAYSVDRVAIARSAGVVAGRILNGARPADIPVQAATRLILAINMSAAAALGLSAPPSLLAIADMVIE